MSVSVLEIAALVILAAGVLKALREITPYVRTAYRWVIHAEEHERIDALEQQVLAMQERSCREAT